MIYKLMSGPPVQINEPAERLTTVLVCILCAAPPGSEQIASA